jgi:hypothetical protein
LVLSFAAAGLARINLKLKTQNSELSKIAITHIFVG